MATRFYLRSTKTTPSAPQEAGGYFDMTIAVTGTGGVTRSITTTTTPTYPDNSRQILNGIFYGERFSQSFTLSGTITVSQAGSNNMGVPMRWRVKLSKITAGGSNVETPIAAGDGTADIAASNATQSFTLTPFAPITIAPYERLVYRLFAFPPGGTWGVTGQVNANFGANAINIAWVELTETVTTMTNGARLYPRRTSVTGIGGFMDLLTVKGTSTFTTAIVNTVASATEIQWTKTAGGAVAEWITPRFKSGWSFDSTSNLTTASFTVFESNASANAALRIKLFRRTASGVETEIGVATTAGEMPTVQGATNYGGLSSLTNQTYFVEDDRLVLRMYLVPASGLTMGGGQTATAQYDSNTADNTLPFCYVNIVEISDFKAETDPALVPVPSGTSTMGIGNGQ